MHFTQLYVQLLNKLTVPMSSHQERLFCVEYQRIIEVSLLIISTILSITVSYFLFSGSFSSNAR